MYFDGHERDDVKKHRKEYIERQRKKHRQYVRFDETRLDDPSFWTSNPKPFWNPPRGASGLEARPLLKVSHDESIFRLYGFIHQQWFEQKRPSILPKGEGRGFHVSDFITTFGPVKKVDGSPVRDLIGPIGKTCYWNNELFLEQVEAAIRGLNKQYPNFRLDFRFDNAPLHRKKAEDAPVLEKMNKYPGGKPPKMRDTYWELNREKKTQSLVFGRKRKIDGAIFMKGTPKGLLQVARERSSLGARMKKLDKLKRDELINELSKFKDFQNIKIKLVELIDKLNDELYKGEKRITAEFLLKFHCELAEIEMLWRNSKYTFRKENDRNWKTIETRANKALDQFKVDYYSKIFRQVKTIEMAYAGGLSSEKILQMKENNFPSLLKELAKKRKHHRNPVQLKNNQTYNFLTLNEITPRKYLNLH